MLNATCVREENCSYPKRVSYCEFRNNFHTGVTIPQRRRGTRVLVQEYENLKFCLSFVGSCFGSSKQVKCDSSRKVPPEV